jgi:hypothetical protein
MYFSSFILKTQQKALKPVIFYGLDGGGISVRSPAGEIHFSPLYSAQKVSGGTSSVSGDVSPGVKQLGLKLITSVYGPDEQYVEPYLHSLIRQDVELNEARDNFLLYSIKRQSFPCD